MVEQQEQFYKPGMEDNRPWNAPIQACFNNGMQDKDGKLVIDGPSEGSVFKISKFFCRVVISKYKTKFGPTWIFCGRVYRFRETFLGAKSFLSIIYSLYYLALVIQ